MKNIKSTLTDKLTALRSVVATSRLSGCNAGCKGCNTAFRGFLARIRSAGKLVLAADNESGAEWKLIAPYGEWPNEAGLQIFERADAEEMVAAFDSFFGKVIRRFRGLPVFIEHPDHPGWVRQHPGARCDAVGRIVALEARDDGLYGRRIVNGEAAAYAFHSPRWSALRWKARKAFRPVWLHSVGLTNHPNILVIQ